MTRYPESGRLLGAFTEGILRGPSPLSTADRELIAAFTSARNECNFCARSHASAARHLFGTDNRSVVDQVLGDLEAADLSDKMKALLRIAGQVAESGRNVQEDDVRRAREAGADDREIHDTVLIAAAFCMFNRYVDGLATWTPDDERAYDEMGARLAQQGYAKAG